MVSSNNNYSAWCYGAYIPFTTSIISFDTILKLNMAISIIKALYYLYESAGKVLDVPLDVQSLF